MTTSITRRYAWDMAHRLQDHAGKCRRLHGHRYELEVTVSGPVLRRGAQNGMVADFGLVDAAADLHVVSQWDHRTMLEDTDPVLGLAVLDLAKRMQFGIVLVPFAPTAENIAQEVMRRLKMSAADLQVSAVRLYETPRSWAEVRA